MARHFLQELEDLKTRLIRMSSLVESAISQAIKALLHRDVDIARQVIEQDTVINRMEVEIDEAVVSLLALQQPVAVDLRFILSAMKINNDLERIGDHAVNIAESAIQWSARPPIKMQGEIIEMTQITKAMLRDAIDGFIHGSTALCRAVLGSDDLIDAKNRKTVDDMLQVMHADPSAIEQALELIRVSRNLERVADLATNIAEDVIFVAEANVVKHRLSMTQGKGEGKGA